MGKQAVEWAGSDENVEKLIAYKNRLINIGK